MKQLLVLEPLSLKIEAKLTVAPPPTDLFSWPRQHDTIPLTQPQGTHLSSLFAAYSSVETCFLSRPVLLCLILQDNIAIIVAGLVVEVACLVLPHPALLQVGVFVY